MNGIILNGMTIYGLLALGLVWLLGAVDLPIPSFCAASVTSWHLAVPSAKCARSQGGW